MGTTDAPRTKVGSTVVALAGALSFCFAACDVNRGPKSPTSGAGSGAAAETALSPRPGNLPPAGTPKTTVLLGSQLATARRQLTESGAPQWQASLSILTKGADVALAAGPWSVIDKQSAPPSGDKHDYMSQAPYWWPADASPPANPGTPGKCPYKKWDGLRNKREVDPPALTDATYLKKTFEGIFQLALAWYYTGDERYVARAELYARRWFLEPATLMHPNMNFAQGVPCAVPGRGAGIIEASSPYLGDLVDGLAILDLGAPGWTPSDQTGVRTWLGQFLTWLRTSPVGLEESNPPDERNNHESWYDAAVASLAVYLDQPKVAEAALQDGMTLIDLQIDRDGAQPMELRRTMAWHYSNFNGHALCRLAEVGRNIGVDLWAHKNRSGASLATAIDYMIEGGLRGSGGFKLLPKSPAQVGDFDRSEVFYEVHAAAAEAKDANAAAALPQLTPPEGVDMWPLISSCRVAGKLMTAKN
jgi:hypothetical protein